MRPTTIDSSTSSDGHWKTLRQLLPYLWQADSRGLKLRVVMALSLLVAAKLTNIYVPLILRNAVDSLSAPDASLIVAPVGLLLAYGGARVGALAFGELRDALFARVAQNAIRQVALKTFRHLHALSLRFHLERQTGGLTRAIDRGVKGIEFLLFFVLFNVLPTLLEVGLVAGLLWWLLDWRFAAVTLLTIVGYVVLTFKITEWRIGLRRAMNDADNVANTRAVDSLLNYETVKYFGNEEHEARRFDKGLLAYEKAAIRSRTSLSLLNVGQSLIISLGITLMMILAAVGVADGSLSLGDFVMVNAYLLQLAMPLNFLGTVYREIKQSLVDLEMLFRLGAEEAEIKDRPGAEELVVQGGTVIFEDVRFNYDQRRKVLKGISFTVPAGKRTAIVGPSGAGKSTISRLLFRFYEPDSGRILIDGQDIGTVTQSSLRAAIGIVPQDTVLFNDTIYYNISYGRPSAPSEDVEEAAKLARIHDFVSQLPDGYDTAVGERGLKLSGGEKQRVAIARALLKRPAIFLFDEATSSLDTATERDIQRSLSDVSRDRTTLVIAHRLSTVIDADEIIVLRDGEIAERGRHAELLSQRGVYAEMWARQQSGEEEDRGLSIRKASEMMAKPESTG
ncbi:ABC transporter ATP-binding protein/permease [Limibacillus sp. MBR-115]|jgi:ATP-binding cassette subfamily B protein|uniref:ABCB family ABC transporter ATP-binding protein/permease n=1 Tax=Limibacillus sp. MBR-115 TaxID=3156465 RepID=UPI003394BDAC